MTLKCCPLAQQHYLSLCTPNVWITATYHKFLTLISIFYTNLKHTAIKHVLIKLEKLLFKMTDLFLYFIITTITNRNHTSSSSPFPTRWCQRPEFLISRMFCPGHPPGWSAVPAYPFGRNPSISLLVFFLALSYQQLLCHCFLPFSACVHTSVASFLCDFLLYAIHS